MNTLYASKVFDWMLYSVNNDLLFSWAKNDCCFILLLIHILHFLYLGRIRLSVVSYSAFPVFGQNIAFCGPKAWFPEIWLTSLRLEIDQISTNQNLALQIFIFLRIRAQNIEQKTETYLEPCQIYTRCLFAKILSH